jgi:antitoxin (DNA-binding transcriptional repressor) of toxin-antitoxin stability system
MKKISKSKLKPDMLKIFREIEQTGEELVVTDHGKPVLKIIPYKGKKSSTLKELEGTVQKYDNPFDPVGDKDWDLLE